MNTVPTPSPEKVFHVPLTESECQQISDLCDIAVRAHGLRVVPAVTNILARIQLSMRVQPVQGKPETAPEPTKA